MKILIILLFLSLSACSWIEQVEKVYDRAKPVAESSSDEGKKGSQWLCYGEDKGQDWRCRAARHDDVAANSHADTAQRVEPLPYVPAAVEEKIPAVVIEKGTLNAVTEQSNRDEEKSASSSSAEKSFGELKDSYFAVQLYAGSTAKSARNFMKVEKLQAARLLSLGSRRESWHVVLLGVYPTKDEAGQQAAQYNRKRGGEMPWVRSVKGLKKVLLKELNVSLSSE